MGGFADMVEANEDLAGRLARVRIERECTGGPSAV